jgi:hypothetical protein
VRRFGLPAATRLTSDTENQSDPALFIGQGKFVQTWHGKRFAPASVALQPRANSPFEGEIALRCCLYAGTAPIERNIGRPFDAGESRSSTAGG